LSWPEHSDEPPGCDVDSGVRRTAWPTAPGGSHYPGMSENRALYSAELEAPPDWADLQDQLVRKAVRHAAAHAPEVRDRLARAGVNKEAIGGVADLPGIPVLPKDDLPDLQAKAPPLGAAGRPW